MEISSNVLYGILGIFLVIFGGGYPLLSSLGFKQIILHANKVGVLSILWVISVVMYLLYLK
uniref:Uncharacterized protein n=1 Tax=viral metagenome TaxID=1070528 RepID=A0A6C0B9H0_9ZZZZ